jgi:hypothetical protein
MFQSSAIAQAHKPPKPPKVVKKSEQIISVERLLQMKRGSDPQVEDKPIIISDGSLSIFWFGAFEKWARCAAADGGEDLLPPLDHDLPGQQIFYDDEDTHHETICSGGTACTVSITYGGVPDAIVIVKDTNTLVKIHTKIKFDGPIKGPVRHWRSLAHPDSLSRIDNVSVLGGPSFPAPGSALLPALGINMRVNPMALMQDCPNP